MQLYFRNLLKTKNYGQQSSFRRVAGSRTAIWLYISALLLSLNFLPLHPVKNDPCILEWESYNPELSAQINSIDKLMAVGDAYAMVQHISPDSLAYWDYMSENIRNIFSHGYSYYSMKENWVAALAGKLIWTDLAAIVDPHDIIRYGNAACSQQSIVLVECLRQKGIPFRPVILENHYAVEALINNKWRFFDTNMEPVMPGMTHERSISEYRAEGMLPAMYTGRIGDRDADDMFRNLKYGAVSATPAPMTLSFHIVTRYMSGSLWLLPLFLGLRRLVRFSRTTRLRRLLHARPRLAVHGID